MKRYKVFKAWYELSEQLKASEIPGRDFRGSKEYHIETYRNNKLTGFFTRSTHKEAKEFAREWMELGNVGR